MNTHIYTVYQNNLKYSEDNYTYNSGEFIVVFDEDGAGKFLEDSKDGITFTWEKIDAINSQL